MKAPTASAHTPGRTGRDGIGRMLSYWVAALVVAMPFHLPAAPVPTAPAAGAGAKAAPPAAARAKAAGAPNVRDIEAILRLQVFLDRRGFGPGKVDGKLGEFTSKAVDCYNTAAGLAPGDYSAVLRESDGLEVFSSYTVREADVAWVDPTLSTKPPQQARAQFMHYRSLAEFVAERFHTDVPWLARANPSLKVASLKPGNTLQVPNVVPFEIEQLPRPRVWAADPVFANRLAVVDTAYKFVCIFEAGKMLAAFPITPGEDRFVPRGNWKVVIMQAWPTFRWDKSMLQEGKRSNDFHMLPAGPNSQVGVLWAGLDKSGIGLHGTASPETIGRSRSAGCVRLANWDVVRLPVFLRPGCPVIIR